MKQFLAVALSLLVFTACQQKDEAKPQYQFPAGGGAMPTRDDMRLLQEAVKKDPANVNAWIQIGNQMMDTNRFAEAVDAYTKALALDPKNVDVRVDMGTCYRNTGRPDIAVKEYRKAIEINPNHLNAHKNLGVVLAYDLRDRAGAVKEFETYLRLAPNAPDVAEIQREIAGLKAAK